jgi:hypothetical protein
MQEIIASLVPPLICVGFSMVVAISLLWELIVANVVYTSENL